MPVPVLEADRLRHDAVERVAQTLVDGEVLDARLLRALEHHVLEVVGHARLPHALVHRAHLVGDGARAGRARPSAGSRAP